MHFDTLRQARSSAKRPDLHNRSEIPKPASPGREVHLCRVPTLSVVYRSLCLRLKDWLSQQCGAGVKVGFVSSSTHQHGGNGRRSVDTCRDLWEHW